MKTIFRSEADANTRARRFHISFHGEALEYFQIWIVNLILTFCSLGLYFPWAKVRNKRYLIANLSLGRSTGNFDYLAPGWSVFIGWVIALVFVAVGIGLVAVGIGSLVSKISITAASLVSKVALLVPKISITVAFSYLGIFLIFLPWFLVRSMAFNVRYTCFRGLRFSFEREYLPVYLVVFTLLGPTFVSYVVLMLHYSKLGVLDGLEVDPVALENSFVPLTLTLQNLLYLSFLWILVIFPRTLWALHKYKVGHYSLGLIGFSFETRLGAYYGVFIKSVLPLLLLLVPVFLLLVPMFLVDEPATHVKIIFFLLVAIVLTVCFFPYRALMLQCFWGGVWLKGGQGRIRMEYPLSEYMFVQLMMLFATVFSAGLLRPWAKVYQYEYLARHAFLEAAPGLLDGLMEGDEQAVNAVGAEHLDLRKVGFDLDFGL